MAMQIRRYGAERIAQYGRSRDTLDATGRRHRASIRPISASSGSGIMAAVVAIEAVAAPAVAAHMAVVAAT
jgi:hypothetical protein